MLIFIIETTYFFNVQTSKIINLNQPLKSDNNCSLSRAITGCFHSESQPNSFTGVLEIRYLYIRLFVYRRNLILFTNYTNDLDCYFFFKLQTFIILFMLPFFFFANGNLILYPISFWFHCKRNDFKTIK
jgi:hypothetical protein